MRDFFGRVRKAFFWGEEKTQDSACDFYTRYFFIFLFHSIPYPLPH